MCVETGEGDGSSEVGILSLWHRLVVTVQMLLGEAKVNDEDLTILSVKNEIRSLHITMDKATLMYFFDRNDHFDEDLNRDFKVISLLETPPCLSQVDSEEVHDDEILLSVLNILVGVWNVL